MEYTFALFLELENVYQTRDEVRMVGLGMVRRALIYFVGRTKTIGMEVSGGRLGPIVPHNSKVNRKNEKVASDWQIPD